jgi:AcrR family transcriptional regulator
MARPKHHGPTLERLRRAAAELFAENGYGGTSMGDIAARIGIRKASLYNYYPSKEELLLDILRRGIESWRRECRPALVDSRGSYRQRLRAHLDAAVGFTLQHPHDVATLRLAAAQVGGEAGRRASTLLVAYRMDYLRAVSDFFRAAIAAGEVAPADPYDLALAWRAFLDGLVRNLLLGPSDASPFRERLAPLWTLCWRGLSGRGLEPAVLATGSYVEESVP